MDVWMDGWVLRQGTTIVVPTQGRGDGEMKGFKKKYATVGNFTSLGTYVHIGDFRTTHERFEECIDTCRDLVISHLSYTYTLHSPLLSLSLSLSYIHQSRSLPAPPLSYPPPLFLPLLRQRHPDNLVAVEQAHGVIRHLEFPHRVHGVGAQLVRQVIAFDETDAVLAGGGAFELDCALDHVVHEAFGLFVLGLLVVEDDGCVLSLGYRTGNEGGILYRRSC